MDQHPQEDLPVPLVPPTLTNHVFAHVGHGVELLLADLAGEFLLGVAVHDLDVLVEGPELLEGFVTGDALGTGQREGRGEGGSGWGG